MFSDFIFYVFDPSILGYCIFLNSIPFLTIVGAPDASIGGDQVWFGHQKQSSLP
jgi:hypothetical protein